MASDTWPTKPISVATLQLDSKNPRLGREKTARAPREILQHLFEHDKAFDIAESITARGFFPNEPLLAVVEGGHHVVVEGNRRLAALKALRQPGLLEGKWQRQVERLARRFDDINDIARVPVTTAPSRRATDRLIAGRHVGTPVLAWQAENRASFILDKIAEGYSNDDLRDKLGFALKDIQEARQTRAIADMARSLDLAPEVKAKLDNPRTKLFSTLERVFDSSVGRAYLHVEPDPDHGLRGKTTKTEFIKGFSRLVNDIALGKQSSRSLNTNDNIKAYFEGLPPENRPQAKRGGFVPSELIKGVSVASTSEKREQAAQDKRSSPEIKTVLPKDLKIRIQNARLVDIRRELTRLNRTEFPNCGAVLLRVFFELTVLDYLKRSDRLEPLIAEIEKRENRKIPYHTPNMKQLVQEIISIAKANLSIADARLVEKAVTYHPSAPFTINELHGFVHSSDMPSERDIFVFWNRISPLIRFMLDDTIAQKT